MRLQEYDQAHTPLHPINGFEYEGDSNALIVTKQKLTIITINNKSSIKKKAQNFKELNAQQ